MTTYTAIASGEIDSDSPVNTGLMTKLRDNPIAITEGASGAPQIQTAALADDAVTAAKLANDSVGTDNILGGSVTSVSLAADSVEIAELHLLTDEKSVAYPSGTGSADINFTATGGLYRMGWQIYRDSRSNVDRIQVIEGDNANSSGTFVGTSYAATCSLEVTTSGSGSAGSVYARYGYISNSPPYKISETDFPLFLYAAFNSNLDLTATSASLDPPWVYNGKHRASDHVKNESGETVCVVCVRENEKELEELKKRDIKTWAKEYAKSKSKFVEQTLEMKNENMFQVPNAILPKEGQQSFLILPDDQVMDLCLAVLEEGSTESIASLIRKGYLKLSQKNYELANTPDELQFRKLTIA